MVPLSYKNSFVQQTDDGGYILASSVTNMYLMGYRIYLAKTNGLGELEWDKVIGAEDLTHEICGVLQANDGGNVVGGFCQPFSPHEGYAFLAKTGADGTFQWERWFNGSEFLGAANDFQKTCDGGYILAGKSYADLGLPIGYLVVKTDSNGNSECVKESFNSADEFYSVYQTCDGGFIAAGKNSLGAYLCKLQVDGEVEWDKNIGAGILTIVRETNDCGFIVARGYDLI